MLSLKDGKGSIHIADIMPKGRGKAQPIYYFFDVDDKRLNKVDEYASLLKSEFASLKDKLRINQAALDSAIKLLQSDSEVPEDETAPVRKAYYFLKKRVKEKLREEIDVSDTKDKIIWNIPDAITEWPGTAFIAGSSGSVDLPNNFEALASRGCV